MNLYGEGKLCDKTYPDIRICTHCLLFKSSVPICRVTHRHIFENTAVSAVSYCCM